MAEEQVKKNGLFDLKLVALGLVLFILGGALTFGLSVILFGDDSTLANKKPEEVIHGPLVEVGEFTVNIANPEGKRFLKTEIHLEVKNEEVQKLIEPKKPIIRDKILTVLSSKTITDLEVYNRDNLKQELLNQVNSVLGGEKPVQNIYFGTFIMQ
ncbi:MAG: flagellar basal body-associated FliL family protein [Syntrophomonadaceae bacterium]|nr:flagellar basal body-associated FliL family protein [Syntrophomonadaceae bacterium]